MAKIITFYSVIILVADAKFSVPFCVFPLH